MPALYAIPNLKNLLKKLWLLTTATPSEFLMTNLGVAGADLAASSPLGHPWG